MNIIVKNRDTNDFYRTASVRSLNTLEDGYGKYFDNRDINKIINAKEVTLPSEQYAAALAYDTKHGHIINEVIQPPTTTQTHWRDEPATSRQYGYIRSLGYDVEEKLTKGEASRLIDMIKAGEAGSLNLMRYDGAY
ncbi:MAG: hypothetical protein ACOX5F_00870 [Anaerovoracaceae bacterium]|jgi:hypothetical protein